MKNTAAGLLLLACAIVATALPAVAKLGIDERAAHHAAAVASLERAAKLGDVEAAYRLGALLAHYARRPADVARAEHYLRAAARQDHPGAQHRLGLFLMDDEASDARRAEGLFWLGSAASLGDPVAALVLGRLHQEGLYGIEVDPCLALDWYGVAAAMGMAAPQRFLAPTVERAERRC